MGIELKSTGTLIGELITTALKIDHMGEKPEFLSRRNELTNVINTRLQKTIPECTINSVGYALGELVFDLSTILSNLWDEQEVLYKFRKDAPKTNEEYKSCAEAGINSLKLNAKRSELIIQIDKFLGEESTTFLEKSFQ